MGIKSVPVFLRKGRDLIFEVVEELQTRISLLRVSAQVAVNSLADELIGAVFGLVRTAFNGGFSLLNTILVLIIGSPSRPVNTVDYAAGFADGRQGMVPAKRRRRK